PPSIPSTQSRTIEKAGSAAITAPNPTRLATLRAGRMEALAPASMLCRSEERRPRLQSMTVAMATASATTTDHTPATPEIEGAPKRSSARKGKVQPRQHNERHQEIHDDDERQRCKQCRRSGSAAIAMM